MDWRDPEWEQRRENYLRHQPSNEKIFAQTAEIMNVGHFTDRLAWPVFEIGYLMAQRAETVEYFERTEDGGQVVSEEKTAKCREAADLLFRASQLMDEL